MQKGLPCKNKRFNPLFQSLKSGAFIQPSGGSRMTRSGLVGVDEMDSNTKRHASIMEGESGSFGNIPNVISLPGRAPTGVRPMRMRVCRAGLAASMSANRQTLPEQ